MSSSQPLPTEDQAAEMKQDLGLFSAVTIVSGSMIGSGIFIVSADIARQVGTGGLMVGVWVFVALLTLMAAYSYGKLAGHMPRAGGQYVFLKEAWGDIPAFLYGWALFAVIQTGTIAAVAVGFGKFLGVLWPAVSSQVLIPITPEFGISSQQVVAVLLLLSFTAFNCTGVKNGAMLQNLFTVLKVLALAVLILIGFSMGSMLTGAVMPVDWSLEIPQGLVGDKNPWAIFAAATVGALFSADAWNNVTFIGGEIKEPKKNLPKALLLGTLVVLGLYCIVNVAYLNVLSLEQIQHAPEDRVATAMMSALFGEQGALMMAAIILVSTFGCLNGMVLAGARVLYAMAKDGLLLPQFAKLHPETKTPNVALWVQGIWACLLALSGQYGQLLDYVVFTALLFYVLTIGGLLKMAKTMPEELQMKSPLDYAIPVLYLVGVCYVSWFLLVDPVKWQTSLMGLGLTLIGLVFYAWFKRQPAQPQTT